MRIGILLALAGLLVGVLTFSSATPAYAHGGGLDSRGCHNDGKAGNYHCHQGTCAGQTFGSKAQASACRL